jgi:hypothetical protein
VEEEPVFEVSVFDPLASLASFDSFEAVGSLEPAELLASPSEPFPDAAPSFAVSFFFDPSDPFLAAARLSVR